MTTPDTTTPGGDNAAMMGFLKSAIAELMNSLGPNEDLPPTFIFLRRATEPVLVQFAHLAWPEQRDEALSLARSLVALCSPWAAGILVFGWASPDVSQGSPSEHPDRVEVLVVNIESADGRHFQEIAPIHRQQELPPSVADKDLRFTEVTTMQGRLTGMFGRRPEEVPAPVRLALEALIQSWPVPAARPH